MDRNDFLDDRKDLFCEGNDFLNGRMDLFWTEMIFRMTEKIYFMTETVS